MVVGHSDSHRTMPTKTHPTEDSIFAPLQIPISRRLETFAVVMYLMTIPFYLSFFFVLLYNAIWNSSSMVRQFLKLLLMAYFAYYIIDFNRPFRGTPTRSRLLTRLLLPWIRRFKDYFPLSIKLTPGAEKAFQDMKQNPKPILLGSHPHGILAIGTSAHFLLDMSWLEEAYSHIEIRPLTLNLNLMWPFWRDWLLGLGAGSVERVHCDKILSSARKEGRAKGVLIVVGGAREALDAIPGCLDLTLNSRNGFFRLALRHGATIFPVLNFGENDLWSQFQHPLLRKIQHAIVSHLGFSTPYFFGRGIFNYKFGWLPRRRPVTTLIGDPIDVGEPRESISAQDISALRQRYIEGLEGIYSQYKDDFEVIPVKNGIRVLN